MYYSNDLISDEDLLSHHYQFRITKHKNSKILETGMITKENEYGEDENYFVVRLTRVYRDEDDCLCVTYVDMSMDTYCQIVSMSNEINNRFTYQESGKFFENNEVRLCTQTPYVPMSQTDEHLLSFQDVDNETSMIFIIQSTFNEFVAHYSDIKEQHERFLNNYDDSDSNCSSSSNDSYYESDSDNSHQSNNYNDSDSSCESNSNHSYYKSDSDDSFDSNNYNDSDSSCESSSNNSYDKSDSDDSIDKSESEMYSSSDDDY